MRNRLVIGLLAMATSATAALAVLGNYDFVPDEDGPSSILLLRPPPFEGARVGPLADAPLFRSEATYRIELRFFSPAPSEAARTRVLREVAAQMLPGFSVQPRPPRFYRFGLWRAPLAPPPGFEFVHVLIPPSQELTTYENASSDPVERSASGQRKDSDEVRLLARETTLIDFHVRGEEAIDALPKVDQFVAEVARRLSARIKTDDYPKQFSPEQFLARRSHWLDGLPFAPSYIGFATLTSRTGELLFSDGAGRLGMPELVVEIPHHVGTQRMRELLVAALAERFVERRTPDGVGRLLLDVRALRHPDIQRWADAMLGPGATGKLALRADEENSTTGRMVRFRIEPVGPSSDPRAAFCEFAGCDVSATFQP